MSNKKPQKREDRVKRGKGRKKNDFTSILWAFLVAFCAVLALVVKQTYFSGKTPDSYETIEPEEVVEANGIDPEILKAISVYLEPETHPNKNIRGLPEDLSDWPPGERGVGVKINEKKLSRAEREKKDIMFRKHAFNEYVSELVSYNRSLPDWRGDWCRSAYPSDTPGLPTTSIVICFHNEAWSTLIRTLHSIINRTPDHLVEEILLIDDNSDMPHLKEQLDEYLEKIPKARIIHSEERLGVIRCRMKGSEEAKGQVLTYLDSHIEAGIGWLEPLIHRVHDDPKIIASPVIDAINDTTLWYTFIERDIKGLLNWNMRFEWQALTDAERGLKPNIWAPHTNPVMSGGLFAIDRDWFQTIGYYDTGMEVWGGENFEVSFKAWMCGGRIEIAPCSRVGHIFRTQSPYKVDTRKNVAYNNIRVAEVWMDEFKYLFYDRLGHYHLPQEKRLNYYGDGIEERRKLRETLGCKSFKWYLDKVINRALPYHVLKGAGEIKNDETGFCVDQNDDFKLRGSLVYAAPCHGGAGNQYWWMNSNNYLMRDYLCLGVLPDGETVSVMVCSDVQAWKYDIKTKQFKYQGKCMAVGEKYNTYVILVTACNANDPLQQWHFTRYKSTGLSYTDLTDETLVRNYS